MSVKNGSASVRELVSSHTGKHAFSKTELLAHIWLEMN